MSTGRQVLVAVYAVFALAAGARSVVQLLTKGDEAPLAYTLSLLAAVVYLVATLALRRTTARAHRVAFAAVRVRARRGADGRHPHGPGPELFPDQTVWSTFGAGYGFVPLVLPMAGLWWLRAAPRRPGRQVIVIPPSTGASAR